MKRDTKTYATGVLSVREIACQRSVTTHFWVTHLQPTYESAITITIKSTLLSRRVCQVELLHTDSLQDSLPSPKHTDILSTAEHTVPTPLACTPPADDTCEAQANISLTFHFKPYATSKPCISLHFIKHFINISSVVDKCWREVVEITVGKAWWREVL